MFDAGFLFGYYHNGMGIEPTTLGAAHTPFASPPTELNTVSAGLGSCNTSPISRMDTPISCAMRNTPDTLPATCDTVPAAFVPAAFDTVPAFDTAQATFVFEEDTYASPSNPYFTPPSLYVTPTAMMPLSDSLSTLSTAFPPAPNLFDLNTGLLSTLSSVSRSPFATVSFYAPTPIIIASDPLHVSYYTCGGSGSSAASGAAASSAPLYAAMAVSAGMPQLDAYTFAPSPAAAAYISGATHEWISNAVPLGQSSGANTFLPPMDNSALESVSSLPIFPSIVDDTRGSYPLCMSSPDPRAAPDSAPPLQNMELKSFTPAV